MRFYHFYKKKEYLFEIAFIYAFNTFNSKYWTLNSQLIQLKLQLIMII